MTKVIELEKLTDVDESEFKEWLKNPITQIMIRGIENIRDTTKNSLFFEIDFRAEGMNKTLFNKGMLHLCSFIEKYDYNEFDEAREAYLEDKENDIKIKTSRYDGNS